MATRPGDMLMNMLSGWGSLLGRTEEHDGALRSTALANVQGVPMGQGT